MKLTGVFAFLALALPVVLSAPTLVRRGGYEGGSSDNYDYGKSTDDSSTSTSAEGSGSWATTTTTTLYTSTTTSSESVWTTTSSYTPYPSETGVPSSSVSSSSSSSSSVATCEFDRSTGDVICEAASSSASSSSASGSDQSGQDVIEHHEGGETHGFDDNEGDEGDDDSHEGGYDGAGNNGGSDQDHNAGSSSSCSSSSSGSGDGEWHNSNDDRDIRLLNLALSVSHMSQAFYNQSLCAYSKDDFASKGYPSWVRERYEQIKEHQDEHVAFLYKAIHSAGGSATMECQYSFSEVTDAKSFVKRSETIETIAASAFNGLVKRFHSDEYRTAISSMMATQARHATWINSDVRHKNPWNTAFETPITLNMTFSLLNDFIIPGSCPSTNDISITLPDNLVDYPSLELPERIKAGHKTAISFNASSISSADATYDDGKHGLYAAFKVGTETYYEKVWVENGQQYVMVPEEVKAKGAVYIVIAQKDEERGEDVGSSPSGSGSGMGVFSSCSASSSSACGSGSGSGTENRGRGEEDGEERADGTSDGRTIFSSSTSSSSASSASSAGGSTSSSSSSSASSSASSAFGENNDCSGSNDSNRRRRHHNVIAGPALVMFPFNSEGKPVAGLQSTSKW